MMTGDEQGGRPDEDAEDPIVTASRDASALPEEEENEVLRETRRIRELRERAERAARNVGWKTAAGIGIGSAALLAAALYASRKKD